MRDTVGLPVEEPSQAGEARRIASGLAERAGLDEVGRGRVALVVTELANNLGRHATGGVMVLSILQSRGVAGFEVLAIDKGPGMADLPQCLVDGYSTAGTPGNGLGAVSRIADEFDALTEPGRGSVILARLWAAPRPREHPVGELEWGGVCLPVGGERECGDAWAVVEEASGRSLVMMADGLGHGPMAARASGAAIGVLGRSSGLTPSEVIREAHEATKGTRGAAVAVASIDRGRREVRFSGVGNIAATIIGPEGRHGLLSHSGTVGLNVGRVQEFAHAWPDGSLLVLHSDGLTAHWKLDRASPLASRHPALIAGALYRDFARDRDDSTVVIAREGRSKPS